MQNLNVFDLMSNITSPMWTNSKKTSNKLFYVLFLALVILIAMESIPTSTAFQFCRNRGNDNEPEPNCTYGTVTDFCNKKVCAKGPGQDCGVGLFKMLGVCGDGLTCKCRKCIGCSLDTLECYDKTCV